MFARCHFHYKLKVKVDVILHYIVIYYITYFQGGQQAEQVPQVRRLERESSDHVERTQFSESILGIVAGAKQAL